MSRFLSESRFANAVNKLPRVIPADNPLASTPRANRGASSFSTGSTDFEDLDDYSVVVERNDVSRRGLFRRTFRSALPEAPADRSGG